MLLHENTDKDADQTVWCADPEIQLAPMRGSRKIFQRGFNSDNVSF